MTTSARRRKVMVLVLLVFGLLLFSVFATLNAWDPKILKPATTGQIFVYTALSALAFLLFLGVLLTLVRNVLKLYADQKSRVMGSRLRTRMLWGAVLVSLVPVSFFFCFSYLLMNRAVERWFTQPVTEMRDDSNRMALELSQYTASNARVEAEAIAATLPALAGGASGDVANRAAIERVLRQHEITLQGGFALVFRDGHAVAAFHLKQRGRTAATVKPWLPPPGSSGEDFAGDESEGSGSLSGSGIFAAGRSTDDAILAAAQRSDQPIYTTGTPAGAGANGLGGAAETSDYSLGLATVMKRNGPAVNVVVGLPLPYGMSSTMERLRVATDSYWRLVRGRQEIRKFYMLLLLMITSLALFASSWLALHLSKQVTKPVEALADAMESIAAGDYGHRVQESATEELGELVRSFNHMAQDLEGSRAQVEASTTLLSTANAALEARRSELETMLQTIPNGVATLDAERRIALSNRALSEMLDPGGQRPFLGLSLEEILPPDMVDGLDRLMRRSHRMGSAAGELEMAAPPPANGDRNSGGTLNLLATVALLETSGDRTGAREHVGYVLVLENATELLQAQKQSAWKEVARRVAHEIKNPLTPISLNAEQIGRHIGRLDAALTQLGGSSASVAVIRRGSEVISASVESMRGLVDQFAALAQFPTARPRPADLNTIAENSLAMFAGRTQGVRVIRRFAGDLPLVLADPEAMKRALGNLIDNAVEAMQGSLLREMRISTVMLESGMVELTIADTGTGLTDDMRERLFLPYFSTKQRGTGLGLAIAAKIIQEHEGTIRAEKNEPAGAKFIVELKPASVGDPTPEERPAVAL